MTTQHGNPCCNGSYKYKKTDGAINSQIPPNTPFQLRVTLGAFDSFVIAFHPISCLSPRRKTIQRYGSKMER